MKVHFSSFQFRLALFYLTVVIGLSLAAAISRRSSVSCTKIKFAFLQLFSRKKASSEFPPKKQIKGAAIFLKSFEFNRNIRFAKNHLNLLRNVFGFIFLACDLTPGYHKIVIHIILN